MASFPAVRVSCDGKTPYPTWERANQGLKRSRVHDRHGRGDMHVYRCRYCHNYHVGRSS